MIASLSIPQTLMDQMRDLVSAQAIEVCGLIAGIDHHARILIPIANQLHSPIRFRMDPLEQLRALDRIDNEALELLAIYHSHPNGPAIPSPTDVDEASYPVVNIIWSRRDDAWTARGFWIEGKQVTEVPLDINHQST
jgi:proteasome lid subunit RPN8/RPN11